MGRVRERECGMLYSREWLISMSMIYLVKVGGRTVLSKTRCWAVLGLLGPEMAVIR